MCILCGGGTEVNKGRWRKERRQEECEEIKDKKSLSCETLVKNPLLVEE